MGIWNELMYIVMMLFALTSNFSIAATSVCIVLGVLVMLAQKICTGSLPDMDKGLVKMVGIYCVLQVLAALTSANPGETLGELWGTIYRLSPLFMGIGYLQTRRRMAWILVAFAVSVFVCDAMGAYQLVAWENYAPVGTTNDTAFYAAHLLMAIPIFYLMCRQDEGIFARRTIPAFMLVFSMVMYAVVSWGDWSWHMSWEAVLEQSSFVKIFMESGFIGLAAFVMLQGYILYRLVKLYQAEKSLSRSVNTVSYGMIGIWILAGIHLEGMTETSMLQVPIMREYWLLMGLLLAAGKLKLLEAGKVE
ncbi:MAG: hypothetical protein PHQ44_06835 [Anaerovibrio sp.]|nr:hypothetical protein [Anaerovibrio sp.]